MLPLPLVPFEEYMLIDDRPTHPMSFFLKFAFSGPCDDDTLDRALQGAVQRHPLLAATVRQRRKNCFEWSAIPPENHSVQWLKEGPRNDPFHAAPIDLFREPGLRIQGRRRDEATQLQFQFHHSCCDAIGALQFIEELLVDYAAAVDGRPALASSRLINERCLPHRGRFGLTPWKLLGMAHKQAIGLLGARQFLMRDPVPVQPIELDLASAALPRDFPTAHTHELTATETAGLVKTAREATTTVNNLLMRDLFLALRDFRTRRKLGDGHEWLRLSIPMNLRGPADELMSAANVLSMIFLDRLPVECDDAAALLEGIDQEMGVIKRNQLGLTFPLSLRFTRSLPGAIARMRQMSRKEICRGTAVLSNLVRPLLDAPLPRCDGKIKAGEMILEGIEFLPPVRPYTMAAFGTLTYADKLNLTLHFDPRGLTAADAAGLLKDLVRRIVETAHRDQ